MTQPTLRRFAMGDFVTNSQTSLASLYDHCELLKNVLHDVLRMEVGDKLNQVRGPQCKRTEIERIRQSNKKIIRAHGLSDVKLLLWSG